MKPIANRLLTLFIASVSGLFVAGCSSNEPNTSQHSPALKHYVDGVLAFRRGDNDKAISSLRESINNNSDMIMAHMVLGDIYKTKKEYRNALAEYQTTARLDPKYFKHYYNQGLMLQFLDRLRDAISLYGQAAKLNPGDSLSFQNMGAAFLKLNDFENALKFARHAVDLDPKSATAWSNLGVAFDSKQDYVEAENCYRKAIELDSDKTEIAEALAINLVNQKRISEAQSVVTSILKIRPSATLHKRMGTLYFIDRKYEDALVEFDTALKLDPSFFTALNESGWTLITQYNQSMGLDEKLRIGALEFWNRSLKINPNQPKIEQLIKTFSAKFSDKAN